MKDKKNIDNLLDAYFQAEKQTEASEKLQKNIVRHIVSRKRLKMRRIVVPVAASLLLVVSISFWIQRQKTQHIEKTVAQSEIIYEDEDFIIYIKN